MRFFHSFLCSIVLIVGGCNEIQDFRSLVEKTEDTSVSDTSETADTEDSGITPELPIWFQDVDGDSFGNEAVTFESKDCPTGYTDVAGDCDDSNIDVHPGATEICNEIDDNCDGTIDEDVTIEYYKDEDDDGYGNAASTIQACEVPDGFTKDNTDCNDADPRIFPYNLEVCDGLDNDCNDEIDEDAADATTWYPDLDSDGFGDGTSSGPVTSCEAPEGYVINATDCNDSEDMAFPGATEYCDSFDNNCDGVVDEATASGVTTWYVDADADGFGNAAVSNIQCDQPSGYVTDATDCDDSKTAVNPGATEVCNGLDDDCNGSIDGSDAEDINTWYADTDSDGFGDITNIFISCEAPIGYVLKNSDCDDTSAVVFPSATEYCDGVDNNCDGIVDEDSAVDVATWYEDRDEDGYGNGTVSETTCDQPSGYVALDGDCDDNNDFFYPGADEDCDVPNDYNCDGFVGYMDNDGDGFASCEECDDSDSNVFPAATEFCNETDDDCDGVIDEGAVDASTWYYDSDLDGFGSLMSLVMCDQPAGYVSNSTDCNDLDSGAYPGATEYCDGADNDCDGTVDEVDAADVTSWYIDADSDTYGNITVSLTQCNQPEGYVINATDCDDMDSSVHPNASEFCDSVDNDCNGVADDGVVTVNWYMDADGDSYGDPASAMLSCSIVSGRVLDGTDCNDLDVSVNPTADEICDDGIDQDCDGGDVECPVIPAGPAVDEDADGFSELSDCDDSNKSVHPGATEVCDDDIDNDCDGEDLDCGDVDDDGDGQTENEGDCDDTDGGIFTGAGENCVDEIDNDCDGKTDTLDDDCGDMVDDDGDGYAGADCDDTDPAINPEAEDICDNGMDEDCSGSDLDCGDLDADLDGYTADTDCDETDSGTNPGVEEVCGDGIDQNCDGVDTECPPEEPGPAEDWDRDGYSGLIDCNDVDINIHPGATEVANGVDDDCDGVVDEGTDVYDDDSDGYSEAGGDCDDVNSEINPEAIEYCDGVDNDCDGTVDEAASFDADLWYFDSDGDGYGDPEAGAFSCEVPEDYVMDNTDCDDTSSAAFPGNPEVCDDGLDNDCDGDVDLNDTIDCPVPMDSDGDGYTATIDCDDTNAAIHPGATEIANGVDDDCDGVVDEGTDVYDDDGDGYSEAEGDCDDTDPSLLWHEAGWIDFDLDGHGHEGYADKWLCGPEVGYATNNDDCDDSNTSVHPGATEVCDDGIDQDCDGVDEACPVPPVYSDMDSDGLSDILDLFDAPATGEHVFAMSNGVFPAAYQSLDAYWVGEQLEMGAWVELKSSMRVLSIDSYYELDFLVMGLGAGTYRFTMVSAGSISDPSVAVNTTDTDDWEYADFDGGFCGTYSEAFCYPNRYDDTDVPGDGVPDDIESYAVRLTWNGTTYVPAPEVYVP